MTNDIHVTLFGSTEQTNSKKYPYGIRMTIFEKKTNFEFTNDLYDYYNNCDTAKQVQEALKKKYDAEEVEKKEYVVSRYLKYQMVYESSVED